MQTHRETKSTARVARRVIERHYSSRLKVRFSLVRVDGDEENLNWEAMKVRSATEAENLTQYLHARKGYLQVRIGSLENTRATDSNVPN